MEVLSLEEEEEQEEEELVLVLRRSMGVSVVGLVVVIFLSTGRRMVRLVPPRLVGEELLGLEEEEGIHQVLQVVGVEVLHESVVTEVIVLLYRTIVLLFLIVQRMVVLEVLGGMGKEGVEEVPICVEAV